MDYDLFKDWIPAVTATKENLFKDGDEDAIAKKYSAFMINRAMSQYGEEYIIQANEMNIRPWLSQRMQFDYLRFSLPKKKVWSKWAKAKEDPKINTLVEAYNISVRKAEEIADLFSEDDMLLLSDYLFKGGKNAKQ